MHRITFDSLVDEQLPPALARALAAAGHHAYHVADLGLSLAAIERGDRSIEVI